MAPLLLGMALGALALLGLGWAAYTWWLIRLIRTGRL